MFGKSFPALPATCKERRHSIAESGKFLENFLLGLDSVAPPVICLANQAAVAIQAIDN